MNADISFSAMMTKGQHAETRTFRNKARLLPTDTSYRSELATDLQDYIHILKADGSWTPEVRRSLIQGLDNFKQQFPDLFKKVKK